MIHYLAYVLFNFVVGLNGFYVERYIKPPEQLSDAFRYDISLDQAGKLHLFWDISPKTEDIFFLVKAKLEEGEWLGIGFSDYGEKENADLVIFYKTSFKKLELVDTFTDNKGVVHVDKHQDYQLLGQKTTKDVTKLTFKRKFNTCDKQDYKIDNGTTHVIYFIGRTPIVSPRGQNLFKFQVGLQRTQLIKSQIPLPDLPDDVKIFDMTVKNVHVPSDETTYWCETHLLPNLPRKSHIIRYDGIVSNGHRSLVHHMEVFHCEAPSGVKIPIFRGQCPDEGTMMQRGPSLLGMCKRVIGAWAMGAPPMVYPENVGVPIGGDEMSRYVVVQVHFNNPDRVAGQIDSSGIRFYVSDEERQYEAGIMELGLEYTPKNSIPPRMNAFTLTGDCISECTRTALPAEGIVIFASQLHTHTTGIRVYTKHVRNGIELPELNRDDHYSPHFQEIRLLDTPRRILPGDALRTSCTYKTTHKEQITLGGFSISDEMCVNYVHYYPKTSLEVCKSSVDTNVLNGFFKFMRQENKKCLDLLSVNSSPSQYI
ncbi:dopamine beta-hydroxylase-like isoform X2 [Tubulanus polymorphus]|uniref:dopamine beta-hydroxylase-like isoform X2 n=1 Tax=Tubulanus polymorphus TaxID=672921 RepID=UPI003DA4350F